MAMLLDHDGKLAGISRTSIMRTSIMRVTTTVAGSWGVVLLSAAAVIIVKVVIFAAVITAREDEYITSMSQQPGGAKSWRQGQPEESSDGQCISEHEDDLIR